MKRNKKRIVALFSAIVMLLTMLPTAPALAAGVNSVSLTLYNDSVIPEGETLPVGNTSSYTWQMTQNKSNVFRLVVNMTFAQLYQAGEIKLTLNAFAPGGRNKAIERKSFGNESGIFKETGFESNGKKIVAVNTAAINGSASVSVTYQIKPEDIKDYGQMNKTLDLYCTMKAGSETVTSNTVKFSTDFVQSTTIINSGEHEDAYDEIEVYKVNDNAPLIHKDRLKTIDGVFVDAETVTNSNYYWTEYRVPLLSDDPLGLYNHYIEVKLPDGCVFYSAQSENEDSQVTPCEELNYSINTETKTVTVNCPDYINRPHTSDNTDSFYYFVIALDKSKYNNANVVSFREKHVHKDDASIIGYSENTESIDVDLTDWGTYTTSMNSTTLFGNGVAKQDFQNGYERTTKPLTYKLPVTEKMKVSSVIPFYITSVDTINSKTYLGNDEFSIASVNIPAHYLNANGEVVYGVDYILYISGEGSAYAPYKEGKITEDLTVKLPADIHYAYVVYSPTDLSSSKEFLTYGSGNYSYRISPSFTYKFNVSDTTYQKMTDGTIGYVGISATGEKKDGTGVESRITNLISIEELVKEYRLHSASEASVAFSGNHYDVKVTNGIDFNTNTISECFSKMTFVSVLPSNYYGSGTDSVDALLKRVKESVSLYEYSEDGDEPVPLTVYKKNSDGTTDSVTITATNVSDYVSVKKAEKVGDNLKIVFEINFGDYSTITTGKSGSFRFSYSWPMARLEESDLGKKKLFDMISAVYADSEPDAVPAPADSMLVPGSFYYSSADDGSFATSVSSVSVTPSALSDANGNGNTTEKAYFSKTNVSVLDTGETAQSTMINVKTEYTPFSASTYASPAITRSDKEYELRFSFEGYSSSYKELVFVSNLGNASEDLSDWLGTFKAVYSVTSDLSATLSTEVYYMNDVVDISSETEAIKGGVLLGENKGGWALLDDSVDPSQIKAIAVKVTAPVIPKNDRISVYIKMQSNTDYSYDNLYNRVNFGCVAVTANNETKSSSLSDYVVIKQLNPKIIYIKRIKAKDINLENGVPVFIAECGSSEAGVSFPLSYDSGYSVTYINGEQYYEKTYEITSELPFGKYVCTERDSLRYGKAQFEVTEDDGSVNEDNSVSIETSFANPTVTVISTSEKIVYNKLSHTALCVNSFDNTVQE